MKKNAHCVYLDWAATALPDPEILDQAHKTACKNFGNPSSIHSTGREAEQLLSASRKRLAKVLGCLDQEVVFTSGGTEANNMILLSLLRRPKVKKIIISGIEHASVYEPARILAGLGHRVVFVKAEPNGRINPDRIETELDEHTAMVAVMLVNNETGAIQPVDRISCVLRAFEKRTGRKVHMHTDAVQALGKIPFCPARLGIDSASLSAHKIGGPRGVGALYIKKSVSPSFLYTGGGQEGGRRPGTENLPGIHGFTLAAEKINESFEKNLDNCRSLMHNLVYNLKKIRGAVIIPQIRDDAEDYYSPYILSAAFPPVPGEVLVRVLDDEGLRISTGSACSSKKKDRFRILEYMWLSKNIAFSAVRISIGKTTKADELDRLVSVLQEKIPRLMNMAG